MSLLWEIQKDLATPNGDVVGVLRKCKILAARLGSNELTQWVNFELDGYPESHPIPDYRVIDITYYASFMNIAWQVPKELVPMQLVPEEHQASFQRIEFRDAITKAVSFSRTKNGASIQRPELAYYIQGKMYPELTCQRVWGEIPVFEFERLIGAVKNRILDFSLKIEAENPEAGEALPNSHPVAKEKLQPLVQNTFYGPVGNLAQNSENFSQTASIGIEAKDLTRLVMELTAHLSELNLDARQKQRAEAQIITLEAELAGVPDPGIVKQAGRALWNITQGAIGSLIASAAQPGVWHWIQQTLSSFSPK